MMRFDALPKDEREALERLGDEHQAQVTKVLEEIDQRIRGVPSPALVIFRMAKAWLTDQEWGILDDLVSQEAKTRIRLIHYQDVQETRDKPQALNP